MDSIPTIDFSAYSSQNPAIKQSLVTQVRDACTSHGFFGLVNHGIDQDILDECVMIHKQFFKLPLETKMSYSQNLSPHRRGYEPLRAQSFEKKGLGDLKEGIYYGANLPSSHPCVLAKKPNLGPNVYPQEVENPTYFKEVVDRYYDSMLQLAWQIMQLLCETLEVQDTDWLGKPGAGDGEGGTLFETPIATLKPLHYPAMEADAGEDERGIGAHTDFGALSILHQSGTAGLEVLNRPTGAWMPVKPQRGALVVNLGNLMMRWTNDRYISNLHRVINTSGTDRYSIPFFFSGNPDFVVECFETCKKDGEGAKYPPITVGEWISGRYADTYGLKGKVVADLAREKVGP